MLGRRITKTSLCCEALLTTRLSGKFPQASREEVQAILKLADPRPGETPVDVPAAGGFLITHVQTADVRVTAIDPSPVMRALCKQKVAECHLAAMDTLPLRPGSVDVVVLLTGLHHEPHPDRVFAEWRRVLQTAGGRLAIAEVAVETPPARFLNGFVDRHSTLGPKGTFLDDTLLALLREAGFSIGRNEGVHHHWQVAEPEEVGECTRLMFGIDLATPAQIRAAVADELDIDALPGGGFGVRWSLRHVLAYTA